MIGKIANLILSFFLFTLVAVRVHEAGHLFVVNLLGHQASIQGPWMLWGHVVIEQSGLVPDYHMLIIYGSGGLFGALACLLFWRIARWGQPWDADDLAGLWLSFGLQLGMATSELTLIYGYGVFTPISVIGMLVGMLIAAWRVLPSLIIWWRSET